MIKLTARLYQRLVLIESRWPWMEWAYFGTFLLAATVAVIASTSNSGGPVIFSYQDKVLHFVTFFVLSFLFDRGLKAWHPAIKIGILMMYGIGIEIWQSYLPMRHAELGDVVADVLGVVAYYLLIRCLSSVVVDTTDGLPTK